VSLVRKSAGLANKPRFHGVDAIVYVEGGASSSAVRKSYPSMDTNYWRTVFSHFMPERRLRFEPKGGKENLRPLVQEILASNIHNSFVAWDADFEYLYGTAPQDRRIFCTRGYSWENDIFSIEIARSVFFALCPLCETEFDPQNELEEIFVSLRRRLRHIVRADVIAAAARLSVIPRSGFLGLLVDTRHSTKPAIDYLKVKSHFRGFNRHRDRKFSRARRVDIDTYRSCYGHLLGALFVHAVSYLVKKHSSVKTLEPQVLLGIALREMAGFLIKYPESDLVRHHAVQFAR
jgi:hypothetical protein